MDILRNEKIAVVISILLLIASVILATTVPASSNVCTVRLDASEKWKPGYDELEAQLFNDDFIGVNKDLIEYGIIKIKWVSDERIKCKITRCDIDDNNEYIYNLNTDGGVNIIPLHAGSGEYLIKILQHVEGTAYSYEKIYSEQVYAEFENELTAYSLPNDYVMYHSDDAYVKKARIAHALCFSDTQFIALVRLYLNSYVKYDYLKAWGISNGLIPSYIPDAEQTYITERGICCDIAALGTSMLRSCGVPARMVYGYIYPSGKYHAWIEVPMSEDGENVCWQKIDVLAQCNGVMYKYVPKYYF